MPHGTAAAQAVCLVAGVLALSAVTAAMAMQETPIFSNGNLHGTWHWHAVACRACKHSDIQQRRNTSGASFSVDVLEFGSIILTTTTAHPLRR